MKIVALFCADVHLSLTPPIARSAEPDWLKAQGRVLKQVCDLADEHQCPVVCAGDVFDRWNPPVELVNWAIENLPEMLAVPGQHDLPMHRYEDVKRSAYYTLSVTNRIMDMADGLPLNVRGIYYRGFAWDQELLGLEKTDGRFRYVLVAHHFVWTKGRNDYPGAPPDCHADRIKAKVGGYDIAVFGDNHKRFMQVWTGGCLYNCGCLIPRRSDERSQKPAVGLLQEDSRIIVRELNTAEDRWADVKPEDELPRSDPRMDGFVQELGRTRSEIFDYREALLDGVRDSDEDVKREVMEALE